VRHHPRAQNADPDREPPPAATRARPSLRTRGRYEFDNAMARGSGAMVALLALFLLTIVVVFTVVSIVLGVTPTHPITTAYNILLQTIDGGGDLSDDGLKAAALFLLVTIVGLLIFGAFIGTLASSSCARVARSCSRATTP
jgi:hypothetical protein